MVPCALSAAPFNRAAIKEPVRADARPTVKSPDSREAEESNPLEHPVSLTMIGAAPPKRMT